MDYKLTIKIPTSPKGAEIQIAGLGTFENGSDYVISEAEHDNFRRYHGRTELQYNEDNEVTGSQLVLGPTLLQANIHGVEVETVKETAEEKKVRKEKEEAEKKEREEKDKTRRAYAQEQNFDLTILSDSEVDSWIYESESSIAKDAEAKLVVAKTEKGGEQ